MERLDDEASSVQRPGRSMVLGPATSMFFIRVAFRPGYPEIADRNRTFGALAKTGDGLTEDHAATQITAALAPRPRSRS